MRERAVARARRRVGREEARRGGDAPDDGRVGEVAPEADRRRRARGAVIRAQIRVPVVRGLRSGGCFVVVGVVYVVFGCCRFEARAAGGLRGESLGEAPGDARGGVLLGEARERLPEARASSFPRPSAVVAARSTRGCSTAGAAAAARALERGEREDDRRERRGAGAAHRGEGAAEGARGEKLSSGR